MKEKLIFLALGALGGSLITYAVMKTKAKQQEEEIWNRAVKQLQKEQKAMQETRIVEISDVSEDSIDRVLSAYNGLESGGVSVLQETHRIDPRASQRPLRGDLESLLAESESPPEDEAEKEDPVIDTDGIYMISEQQYYGENPYYDKITLMYYEADDTLCYESEEIIHDVNQLVGFEWCYHFEDMEDNREELSTVYVRNDGITTDFEIKCICGSYAEIVAGFLSEAESAEHWDEDLEEV